MMILREVLFTKDKISQTKNPKENMHKYSSETTCKI